MRNSVLELFRHRRLVVIQADILVMCYVYDLVHLGGSEGRKI